MSPVLAQAMAAFQAGDLATAASTAEAAVFANPDDPLAHQLRSIVAFRQGQHPLAIEAGKRAIALDPAALENYTNLGAVYRAAGQSDQAAAIYREALKRDAGYPAAHFNLGNLLRDLGEMAAALEHYERATAAKPDYVDAWYAAGLIYQNSGRLPQALRAYHAALAVAPSRVDILVDLGNVLFGLDQLEPAKQAYLKAAQLQPNFPTAPGNLGALYLRAGYIHEALAATDRALELAPGDHRWVSNRAGLLKELGRWDEAEAAYRQALAIRPDYALGHSNLLFCLNYHPTKPAREIFAEYIAWDKAHARPLRPENPGWAHDWTTDRRLKVGYLSPDFREHAARHFIEPILAHHDPAQVEVYCYAEVAKPDRFTERFQGMAQHWRSTVGLSDAAVADLIRADGIDVLVDMGGHTSCSRLLVTARKPAPVQIAYLLGHGYTSGLSAIDAFLCDDAMAPPEADALFAETIVHLPRIPLAYLPPEALPEVAPLPALSAKRQRLTFGYFGRPERLNDAVIECWSAILTALPGSKLVLNSKAFSETAFQELFAARFAAFGVKKQQLDMVFTAPQPKTWAAYGDIDVALDPFPHNAGTTTIEALWLGVPVISKRDRPSVGRFGASILGAVGLDDWVVDDTHDYVAKAISVANDIAALAALRAGLRARCQASALADGPGLARTLEAAYRDLWQARCAAQTTPPEHSFEQAVAAYRAGDFAGAEALIDQIVAVERNHGEALHLRALCKFKQGRVLDAAGDFDRATLLLAERPDVRWNAAAIYRSAGRLQDAEQQARAAVALAGQAAEAHNNLGTVLKDMGRNAESLEAFQAAVALKPGYGEAWSNMAWLYATAGRALDAEAAARKAIGCMPQDANAFNNLGTSLMLQDRLAEAGEAFAQALARFPGFAMAHSNMLFCLNYRTDLTPEAITQAYRGWDERHAAPVRPAVPAAIANPDPYRRLKVGYVSPDFRHHAVSFFAEDLIAGHDRRQVEVTLYSAVTNPDAVTRRFEMMADRFVPVLGLTDAALADRIRADGIDILVDLAGHTGGNRLLTFARRPAPVQVAHMVGSGATTGLSCFDGYMTDDLLSPPGSDGCYSEPLVRLPALPLVYRPPEGMPPVAPLPALKARTVTFGCFSRTARINDGVLDAWARILLGVPGARLVLNAKAFQEEGARQRFRDAFGQRGISADRLTLVYTTPQTTTWAAYNGIDIALDPFPHNAGTTTFEALWMGVPVVSLRDRPPVGRFGDAILSPVGLGDWVFDTVDDYVAHAIAAARDIKALARLRADLRHKVETSPFCDAGGQARAVEGAYRLLWQRAVKAMAQAA
jgi:predicted O-linked N-acetylglucosamine transferase (SPINDLY family)